MRKRFLRGTPSDDKFSFFKRWHTQLNASNQVLLSKRTSWLMIIHCWTKQSHVERVSVASLQKYFFKAKTFCILNYYFHISLCTYTAYQWIHQTVGCVSSFRMPVIKWGCWLWGISWWPYFLIDFSRMFKTCFTMIKRKQLWCQVPPQLAFAMQYTWLKSIK